MRLCLLQALPVCIDLFHALCNKFCQLRLSSHILNEHALSQVQRVASIPDIYFFVLSRDSYSSPNYAFHNGQKVLVHLPLSELLLFRFFFFFSLPTRPEAFIYRVSCSGMNRPPTLLHCRPSLCCQRPIHCCCMHALLSRQ